MYQNGSWSCVVFAQRANFASYTDATLTMLAMRVAPFRSPRCWTRRSRRRGGGEKGTQVFPVPVDPVVPVLLHCRWHRLHGLWLLHGLQPEGRRLKPPLGTAATATESGPDRTCRQRRQTRAARRTACVPLAMARSTEPLPACSALWHLCGALPSWLMNPMRMFL